MLLHNLDTAKNERTGKYFSNSHRVSTIMTSSISLTLPQWLGQQPRYSRLFQIAPSRRVRLGAGVRQSTRAAQADLPLLPENSEGTPQPEVVQGLLPEASSLFSGLKAFVAGANGRTGRLIVERLASEGIPVRALARNATAAAKVLPSGNAGVQIVQGDVFQYSSLQGLLGDSNVLIIATGATAILNPFGSFNVDYQGTENLVAAAKAAKIKRIVLITSIGVDDVLFPLNLIYGVLFWKKRGEEAVQRSGIDYTIIRPGGLRDDGVANGGLVFEGPDAFGLPPRKTPGSILRKQVAEVVVDSLVIPAALNKVVEIISDSAVPKRSITELFETVGR
eukprot:jgi/Botrbrau1/504/Bobra.110_2s0134.1